MFESLDEINIGKLSLENPKKKERIFFDPNKEISEAAWTSIFDYCLNKMNSCVETSGEIDGYDSLYSLIIASEERFNEFVKLNPKLMEAVISIIFKDIMTLVDWGVIEDSDPESLGEYCLQVFLLKNLNKIIKEPFHENLAKSFMTNSAQKMVLKRFKARNHGRPEDAVKIKILFPALIKNVNLKAEKNYLRNLLLIGPVDSKEIYAYWAAVYRLLFPEDAETVIDKKYERELRARLKNPKNPNDDIYWFLQSIMSLKILSAKEINISDDGLEFVAPEEVPDIEKIPPMPVAKKY